MDRLSFAEFCARFYGIRDGDLLIWDKPAGSGIPARYEQGHIVFHHGKLRYVWAGIAAGSPGGALHKAFQASPGGNSRNAQSYVVAGGIDINGTQVRVSIATLKTEYNLYSANPAGYRAVVRDAHQLIWSLKGQLLEVEDEVRRFTVIDADQAGITGTLNVFVRKLRHENNVLKKENEDLRRLLDPDDGTSQVITMEDDTDESRLSEVAHGHDAVPMALGVVPMAPLDDDEYDRTNAIQFAIQAAHEEDLAATVAATATNASSHDAVDLQIAAVADSDKVL